MYHLIIAMHLHLKMATITHIEQKRARVPFQGTLALFCSIDDVNFKMACICDLRGVFV